MCNDIIHVYKTENCLTLKHSHRIGTKVYIDLKCMYNDSIHVYKNRKSLVSTSKHSHKRVWKSVLTKIKTQKQITHLQEIALMQLYRFSDKDATVGLRIVLI